MSMLIRLTLNRLDGEIGENGVDFVSLWRDMMLQTDFVNANTGMLDPRHLFGATSQDVSVTFFLLLFC